MASIIPVKRFRIVLRNANEIKAARDLGILALVNTPQSRAEAEEIRKLISARVAEIHRRRKKRSRAR